MPHPVGWEDLLVLASSAHVGASAPPFATMVGGLDAYRFDDAQVADSLHFAWHITHRYMIGTPLYPHVHWCPTTTNTGVCRWGIEYSAARGYSLDAFTTTTTLYIEQAASGTVGAHQIAEVADPGLTIANCEPDMIIKARVFRDGTHANDTFTGNAFLIAVDLHHQVNRDGTVDRNRGSGWVPV